MAAQRRGGSIRDTLGDRGESLASLTLRLQRQQRNTFVSCDPEPLDLMHVSVDDVRTGH